MYMEQTKKRKSQKNVTLRDITYEQLHAYCQEHQIKHSEFVEIALHTFLHMHGSPKDICKNIVKEHALQDKMMDDLMKTLLKSNRLQKKILALNNASDSEDEGEITPEKTVAAPENTPAPTVSYDIESLVKKCIEGEGVTAEEAGYMISQGYCPKCGERLQKRSFNGKNNKIINSIQCPDWQGCGFSMVGLDGAHFVIPSEG